MTYYNPISSTIEYESKVDDCYNIGSKIEKVEAYQNIPGENVD
jgi:hypothetical protein